MFMKYDDTPIAEPDHLNPMNVRSVDHMPRYDEPRKYLAPPLISRLTRQEHIATLGVRNPDPLGGALEEDELRATKALMGCGPVCQINSIENRGTALPVMATAPTK
jgi:hypothetical protein